MVIRFERKKKERQRHKDRDRETETETEEREMGDRDRREAGSFPVCLISGREISTNIFVDSKTQKISTKSF